MATAHSIDRAGIQYSARHESLLGTHGLPPALGCSLASHGQSAAEAEATSPTRLALFAAKPCSWLEAGVSYIRRQWDVLLCKCPEPAVLLGP